MQNANFTKANTAPTFLMQNNEDTTPDAIIYSKNLQEYIGGIDIVSDLGSDHMGFKIELNLQINVTEEQCEKPNYIKSDINNINSSLINYINQQEPGISPQKILNFNKRVSEVIKQNTPFQTAYIIFIHYHHL